MVAQYPVASLDGHKPCMFHPGPHVFALLHRKLHLCGNKVTIGHVQLAECIPPDDPVSFQR